MAQTLAFNILETPALQIPYSLTFVAVHLNMHIRISFTSSIYTSALKELPYYALGASRLLGATARRAAPGR